MSTRSTDRTSWHRPIRASFRAISFGKYRNDVNTYSDKFYTSMLMEDLSLGVQSMHWMQSDKRAQTTVSPDKPETKRLLMEALGNRTGRDFDDSLSEFLGEVTSNLVRFGVAPFEIVAEVNPASGMKTLKGFEFVRPDTLVPGWKNYHQWGHAWGDVGEGRARRAKIPRDKMILFEFPRFPKTSWRRLLNVLRLADKNTIPEFGLRAIGEGGGSRFDFGEYRHNKEILVAISTKSIGWDGRGTFNEGTSEWYQIKRRIRYEAFCIEVRDNIIAALNECLKRGLPGISPDTRLSVHGGIDQALIAACDRQLEDGDTSFKDIVDTFLQH